MLPAWSETKTLNERIDDSYDYESPGIYLLSTSKLIPRAMNVDKSGILYIGKSSNLKSRISGLRTSNHNATWFLFNNRNLARFYINQDIPDDGPLKNYVGKLNVTLAKANSSYPDHELEAIALFSYLSAFGEMPPLNNALPKRWEHEPVTDEIEWFSKRFL